MCTSTHLAPIPWNRSGKTCFKYSNVMGAFGAVEIAQFIVMRDITMYEGYSMIAGPNL